MEEFAKISIIIPAYNAAANIENLLSRLLVANIRKEIIIIDSGSTDNTSLIAESQKTKIIRIDKNDFDHGGTRNLAKHRANGDIIIFLTQDVLPFDEFFLELLMRPFLEDDRIGACYGRQLPCPDATSFASHLRLFNYPETSHVFTFDDRSKHGIKTPFLSNSFAAYRRKALDEVGWFPERMIIGEDVIAGAKMLLAGYKIAYTSDAKVYHSHNYSAFQEFRRYFDIGVFHNTENWLIKEFGGAEGEGWRYIQSALSFLLNDKKYRLIPELVLRTALKYVGYQLGYNHKSLPAKLIKKLSMHPNYWND